MESNAILETVNSIIFGSHGVWFLIGAALVYFMQAGFAMCEAGFTRAKNVGNIIMKNLMDFCLGTVAFIFVGYNILCGDASKFWGGFTMNPFDFGSMDCYGFVFNLVFCATCATIVSGAMAERTKFLTYCIYSFVISLLIYPIEAHWVWGGTAWLTDLGFTDFAGSAVIHMVGGVTGFIGAASLDLVSVNMTKTVMQDQSSAIISVLQHLVFSFSGLAGMVSTVPQLQTDSILDRFSPQQHLLLHVQPLSL